MSWPIFNGTPSKCPKEKTVKNSTNQEPLKPCPATSISPHADHPNTLLSSQTTRQLRRSINLDSASAGATRTTLLVSNRTV